MPTVLFRCDAGPSMGHGHLSRCLALAEALEERGAASTFAGSFDAAATERIRRAGASLLPLPAELGSAADAQATAQARRSAGAAALVVDGYAFDADYLARVAEGPLVVIDDFARLSRYPAGAAILNFGLGAEALRYRGDRLQLFLGPAYLLARRALRRARAAPAGRATPPARVLVAIGGYDRSRAALRTVQALLALPRPAAIRVLSGGAGEDPELERALASAPSGSRQEAGLDGLAEPLTWADACVTGGGLTKYEAAYLGVPTAVLSQTAEQAADTARFAARGLCADLGLAEGLDAPRLLEGLSRFVGDAAALRALAGAGRAAFPEDPTASAAAAVWAMIGKPA